MSFEQWAIIVNFVLGVLALLGILFKINKLSFQLGQKTQSIDDKLDSVTTNQGDNKAEIAKTLKLIDEHIKDIQIHINPIVYSQRYEEQKEWRRDIQSKMDKIYERILSGKNE